MSRDATWPALPLDAWRPTCDTLHRWTQAVGKVRLACAPWINHSWSVTLYLTARGLTTSPIPHGDRVFQVDFDFLSHRLCIDVSDGASGGFALQEESVASFYARFMKELRRLGVPVEINTTPNEVADATPLDADEEHRSYDKEWATRFWRVLLQSDRVMQRFRARFIGKCSPVHFFWGAPDLAVTRFSGRTAPPHPGGVPNLPDRVAREAYSHEVSSAGFWPGNDMLPYPAYYSYAYPAPDGYADAVVKPGEAFFSAEMQEFILPYDAVRTSRSPDDSLMEFLESTYEAAASLGGWDRGLVEDRDPR